METPATCRENFANRILYGTGYALGAGAIGGSAFYFLRDGFQAMRLKVPRMAGGLAVCGGLASALDCSMAYAHQKEDGWHSLIAYAATGGYFEIRRSLSPTSRSYLIGAFVGAALKLYMGIDDADRNGGSRSD